jgi:hypothetical protein
MGAVSGLLLFVLLMVILGRAGLPWGGRWHLFFQVVGWGVILAAGILTTGRWIGPVLLASGGVLMYANEILDELISRRPQSQDVFSLLVFLSPLASLVSLVLLVTGAWLLIKGLLKQMNAAD